MKRVYLELSPGKGTTFWCNAQEWQEFKKNCRRERENANNMLRKLILHYNVTKRNPLVKLDVFTDEKAESPMNVICNYLGGATHEGQVYCRKKGSIWIQGIKCYSCPNNKLRGSRKL